MSVQYNTSQEVARNTWTALCAKNGLPDAAKAGSDGIPINKSDLHDLRKTVRQAINKITDSLKPDDYNDSVTDALVFAGNMVSMVNQQFERMDDAARFFGTKQNTDVLKNSADFDRHYNKGGNKESDFEIADFMRGVAKLKSSSAVQNALSTGTDSAGGYTVPGILTGCSKTPTI